MFIDLKLIKIFIKPGATDFRKQINGLSIIVQQEMNLDPLGRGLFLFCNKRRNRLKALYWDKTGFCLWLKRLERNKYPWPKDRQAVLEIDIDKLRMILSGIDFFNAHKEIKNKKVY